jgi:hypothetical protein
MEQQQQLQAQQLTTLAVEVVVLIHPLHQIKTEVNLPQH